MGKLFGVNAKVEVLSAIDLEPYTTLSPGETGSVIETGDDDMIGEFMRIRLDKIHKGLRQWDNIALLTNPEIAYIRGVKWLRGKIAAVLALGAGASVLGFAKYQTVATLGFIAYRYFSMRGV